MVRAGREKNQFLRAAGAPARGAADRGPRGTQKLVRTVRSVTVLAAKNDGQKCFHDGLKSFRESA